MPHLIVDKRCTFVHTYPVTQVRFEWDNGNWPKCGRHGLTQQEIEEVFRNNPAVYPDARHSKTEQRLLAIGQTASGRYAFIVFTLRGDETGQYLRPISARFMHQKEIRHYESL